MTDSKPKVVVAMSGGVDSSVAASLLVEQGYEVVGLFMRVGNTSASAVSSESGRSHQGCCSASDAADARFVAGRLGIPFFALNFEDEFDSLIDYFADEYLAGRTPNPCVVCNQKLKFGRLLDYADAVGARYVATGHYARIEHGARGPVLRRAVDGRKDQTYVLFGVRRSVLDRILFPLGELTKDEVRRIAREKGLPNADKPDSVEICFVPDRDYARVVRERRPESFQPGPIVNGDGEVVATHDGVAHFTIGQRRGTGVAAGVPVYVTAINAPTGTVTVGGRDRLLKRGLSASRCNILDSSVGRTFRADVKIRYLHTAAPAIVRLHDDGDASVMFDEPQAAVTPGQAVVFYNGDRVIGGGWIERGVDSENDGSPKP